MVTSLWPRLRQQLQQQLDPEEFSTWFQPLRVGTEEQDRIVLVAPNERFLHTLEASYRTTIDRAIAGLSDSTCEVLFSVARTGTPRSEARQPPQLNPRYRFANFVVGSSNQFAHAAAKAVAEVPFESYNPLFLYGGVGLGKTHLLHATGHQIQMSHPHLRVMYLPAEQFVNELISSLRFNRMPDFRERYRNIDVFLVDDVQFLANKERTQEEFFHTFNTLYTGQRQIILSSDSAPRNIPDLEERLRSRFEWGLIADIQPPDLETKIAILRRKAEAEHTELPDEVAHFVAQQVRSNIRELEGLLNRVVAFSSLTGRHLSLDLARETLKDILPEQSRVTAPEIIKTVARHYGLKVSEIKSRKNSQQIVFPRQVAMYLCKQLTELSFPEIGKQFNDKHHSTVMYSVDKITRQRSSDADLNRSLEHLERHFA
ncbi:MAG: chromosomal replication initiator protein DnaA [Acidobacteriota bacterium]|nr:chromosomal replication initiator protein DnaA [Acidobacteriota bacterium]